MKLGAAVSLSAALVAALLAFSAMFRRPAPVGLPPSRTQGYVARHPVHACRHAPMVRFGRSWSRGAMPPVSRGTGPVRAERDTKVAKFVWQLIPEDQKVVEEESQVSKALASFPIVGLLMQLATAEGGLDGGSLRFSEFARRILDNVEERFYESVEALRSIRGQEITFSTITYCLWTSAYGAGIMPRQEVMDTCRRLSISRDLEYEMAMYEDARDSLVRRNMQMGVEQDQQATLKDQVELSVDCLARLLQLKQGTDIPEGIQPHIATIVQECYPSAPESMVDEAIQTAAIRTAKPRKPAGKSSETIAAAAEDALESS